MSGYLFICIAIPLIIIGMAILLTLSYKFGKMQAPIDRNNELMDACDEKVLKLLDNVLFALPREVFIPHADEENQDFEVQEMIDEYLETILLIYDTCGRYCSDAHFTEEQLKQCIGNYILFLKEDKTLIKLIESQPGYYEGAEYLLKTCA